MTTLHHLNASRSDRIFWLFEELSIPYDVVVHWRTARGLAPESLKQVFPLGKAPVVVEDGTPLAESGAIVHYYYSRHAANKAGASLEAQTSQYSTYWSHFAEGSLMLQLQPAFVASKIREGISAVKVTYILPFFQKGAATFYEHFAGVAEGNIKTYLAYTEKFLGEHGNFSGDKDVIGEGDFMMFYPLDSLANAGRKGQYELGPNILAWIKRMQERPAMQRAQARQAEEEEKQRPGKESASL